VSPTIEVCCHGAGAEGHKKPLRLEYRPDSAKRNVRLGLPRFVKDLLHIPPRTLDLLELAAYIYAADRHTRRGSREAVEFHAWSRRFRFRMRVRDVDFGHRTPPTSLFDQEGTVLPQAGPHIA
jgi:hypothetical protein